MSGPLFPTFSMPSSQAQLAQAVPPVVYDPAPAFDFERGDFVLDGAGRTVMLDGYAAWAQWCVKAALTQRFAYPVYAASFGVDLARIQSLGDHPGIEAAVRAELAGALRADPRTRNVASFVFSWSGDALSVSFVVTPTVGTSQKITVALSF